MAAAKKNTHRGDAIIGIARFAALALVAIGAAGCGDDGPTDPGMDPWSARATEHRGKNFQTFEYNCPAGGTTHAIWGPWTYTDDSSVCTAAAHTGYLSRSSGGRVTIEIRAGLSSYEGSTRNQIRSNSWASHGGSFIVLPPSNFSK
jgi:hypothetical protein